MAQPSDSVIEPIPISCISGRYLVFDIDVVTHLRKKHNICGVLTGSIPQIPQQNVFLGIPLQLLPEEAKLLVHKEVAYIVGDAKWHIDKFRALATGSTDRGAYLDRRVYLDSLRAEGLKARQHAEEVAAKKTELGLAKQAMLRAKKEKLASPGPKIKAKDEPSGVNVDTVPSSDPSTITPLATPDGDDPSSESLFSSSVAGDGPSSTSEHSLARGPTPVKPYTITPTTSYKPRSLPQTGFQPPDPVVPASYPLFAHLHSKGYFITPGLRFGCDYTCYPGDPLRFHSHFLAVGYDWEQEIPLMDIIGGGRLGTGVKKGFLIGGKAEASTAAEEEEGIRTFCIEWGGM